MVVGGRGVRGKRAAAYVVAIVAALPLLAAEAWSGFRLGLADPVLSAMSNLEQPLSVRSPGGIWAMGLALAWFGLAYWRCDFKLWEAALVFLGGAAALARMGNTWLDGAALVLPLARQVALLKLPPIVLSGAAATCLVVAGITLAQARPPELPTAALQAVQRAPRQGKVLVDWRWAAELQRQLGSDRSVIASGGLTSEPTDFWLDYARIAQGHEHWADLLRRLDVGAVLLNSGDQQHKAAELVRSSPDWRVTYDAGDALVAERASP
jgi:hypothetical protein